MTKLTRSLTGLGLTTMALLMTLPAQAGTLEMQVYPAIDTQTVRCPEKVTLTEKPQPYREGGYTIDGSANLSQLADRFSVASADEFSVTWVGTLKPTYRQCKATARIVKNDEEAYLSHSYLRLRFTGGKVYLILDMTGMSDANGLTTAILRKGVRNGNPVWSWGGTD
ncbi:MAG: hypothetical protein KME45_01325 [Stenomitos rutilans HA7619-LM2]|jgi:hypothetical protein|nr:hypothetical protein [Stenomitos rutilans HA7619-LM2]